VAALARSQAGATAIVVLWWLLLDPLVMFLAELTKRHLPWLHQVVPYPLSQASAALMTAPGSFRPDGLLPMWGGALVLVGWVAVLLAVARVVTVPRDV